MAFVELVEVPLPEKEDVREKLHFGLVKESSVNNIGAKEFADGVCCFDRCVDLERRMKIVLFENNEFTTHPEMYSW